VAISEFLQTATLGAEKAPAFAPRLVGRIRTAGGTSLAVNRRKHAAGGAAIPSTILALVLLALAEGHAFDCQRAVLSPENRFDRGFVERLAVVLVAAMQARNGVEIFAVIDPVVVSECRRHDQQDQRGPCKPRDSMRSIRTSKRSSRLSCSSFFWITVRKSRRASLPR
jgi:hypothetical protein